MAFVYEIVVGNVGGYIKVACFSDKFGYILTKQIIFTDSSAMEGVEMSISSKG